MKRHLAVAAIACASFACLLCHRPALTPAYVGALPGIHPSPAALPVRDGLRRALISELGGDGLPDSGDDAGGYVHVMAEAGSGLFAVVFAPASRRGASDNGEIYVFVNKSFGHGAGWRCTGRLCGNAVMLEPGSGGRPNLITRWHLGQRQGILKRYIYDRTRGRYLARESMEYDESPGGQQ